MTRVPLKDLVHYIVYEATKRGYTLTKKQLCAILWKTDVQAYHETGESLTGETYIKEKEENNDG